MVESKMHEPKSTGFDDPREWSDSDLKQFLKDVSCAVVSWEVETDDRF